MKIRPMISVFALALLLGYSAQTALAEMPAAGDVKPKAKIAHKKVHEKVKKEKKDKI